MDAGAGDLARGPEPGHPRAALEVHVDTAHVVVRGRGHGNRTNARVEAVQPAGLEHGREPLRERLPHRVARVEEGAAARGERGPEGPRDYVAGLELGLRPGVGQEPSAVGVDERRPGAAQRLGEERHRVGPHVEGGRVELDELEIGEARARAPGEGEAVAGGLGRVGGAREDLADAAGGEDDRPSRWRTSAPSA